MEWLTQNWIWLVVFAGIVWLFFARKTGAGMGGCCGGAAHHKSEPVRTADPPAKEAGPGQKQAPATAHRHGGC